MAKTLSNEHMATMGRRYNIDRRDWKHFLRLANEAKIVDDGFAYRLCFRKNYDECFRAAMTLISSP